MVSVKKGMLTEKQTLCAISYMTNGGNKLAAGRAAGYQAKNKDNLWVSVNKTLRKPVVQELMKEMVEKAEKKLGISVEWKMRKLKGLVDAGLVDIKKDGQIIGVELVKPQSALNGINLLNKMQGHYAVAKTENTHKFDDFDKLKELIKEHEKDY
jgi:uncharacterized protein YuzE